MRRTIARATLALLVCSVTVPAAASPVVGCTANTLPRGSFMVDAWFSWRTYTRTMTGDGWTEFPPGTNVTDGFFVPRLYYGVTDWLTVRGSLPLVDRFREYESTDGQEANTGFGDVVIDPKIQIYKALEGYPRISLLTGVRFPTGDTDGDPPLSDGSTDYLGGAVVTHRFGTVDAHFSVVYFVNGESENGNGIENEWISSFTVETRVTESWSLLWEAKGYFGERPSERYRIYACPGISWSGGRLTVGASAMISAISEEMNTSAVDYDWAPYIRLYYRFF